MDVPQLALPITVLVIETHQLVDFVRGVTGAFGLQLNGRVAWDVGHEVFRFIFIPTDKGGLHGKGGEELQPAERLTRQEGYKRSGRSYSRGVNFFYGKRGTETAYTFLARDTEAPTWAPVRWWLPASPSSAPSARSTSPPGDEEVGEPGNELTVTARP